jgi:hypothetical protein
VQEVRPVLAEHPPAPATRGEFRIFLAFLAEDRRTPVIFVFKESEAIVIGGSCASVAHGLPAAVTKGLAVPDRLPALEAVYHWFFPGLVSDQELPSRGKKGMARATDAASSTLSFTTQSWRD